MKDKYQKIIDSLGKDRVKLNESLARHTTFKIGGPADLFYEAKNEAELIESIELAKKLGVSFLILGNGSKMLVGDKGFRGLVIKNRNEKIEIQNQGKKPVVLAGSGLSTHILIRKLLEMSFGGLEFMVGIPGTVGGAIRGNAGAWQQAIGDKVSRVKILTSKGKVKWLDKKDKKEIETNIVDYLEKRKNQPKEPSVGSIFVNPKPYAAGELIDKCGLKSRIKGKAQISPKHANFIINLGGATAKDVLGLITMIRRKIKKKYGIQLEEEVVRIGEF